MAAAVWCGVCLGQGAEAPATLPAPPMGPIKLDIYLLQERHFPSVQAAKPPCLLGGPNDAKSVLNLNIPLIRRAVLAPNDLLKAMLVMKVARRGGDLSAMQIAFHRMIRAGGDKLVAGKDYEAKPVLTLPVKGAWTRRGSPASTWLNRCGSICPAGGPITVC